jgi:hypothetical protein
MRKILAARLIGALLLVGLVLVGARVYAETLKILGQSGPAISSLTVTISNASPGVVTGTGHGGTTNDQVILSTTGGLPTGLTAGTAYYIISSGLGSNTFQLSATRGGSAINTSSAGSGTHTAKIYHEVYRPSGVTAALQPLHVCNRSGSSDTIRIAISQAATPLTDKSWIAFDTAVPANDCIYPSPAILGDTDALYFYTINGSSTLSAFGAEN